MTRSAVRCFVAVPLPGEVVAALQRLRLWPVLDGYRGRARSDVRAVVAAVLV